MAINPRIKAALLATRWFRRYKITWKRGPPGYLESTEPDWWDHLRSKLIIKFVLRHSQIRALDEYCIPNYCNCMEWINGERKIVEEPKSKWSERKKKYIKTLHNASIRSAPIRLPKREELDKWRAAYDALTELGISI